jgi:hypothetical protein
MESLIYFALWVVPAVVAVLYLVSRYRKIEDRSESLIAKDLALFPLGYFFFSFFSMGGAYGVGPAVRTPTIVFWLLVLVAWVGLHALRWKHVLRLASVSVFIGISAILVVVTHKHYLQTSDKVFWAADAVSMRGDCHSNLIEIGKAMMIYAEENDNRLPISNWTDSISKFTKRESFHCPTSAYEFSYSMNSEALGISTYEAASMLAIVFDGYGGENATSLGPAGLRWAHLRKSSANVLWLAGGVQSLPSYKLYDYIWDRETAMSPDWESWLDTFDGRSR